MLFSIIQLYLSFEYQTSHMSLAVATSLLLILILIEVGFLVWVKKERIPFHEIVFNLNSGHVLLWVFRGVEVVVFRSINIHFDLGWLDSFSSVGVWIFTFVAWDFCFYWLHRLHHSYKSLWAVHVVHHEGEHFSLSLGVRNSWYSSLTSIPFFLLLAIVGVPVEVFIGIGSIHYFIQFYNHNRVVNNSGWLEYIMITPSHHRVHHGYNAPYLDKNFGGTLVIWDKLFGTFQKKLKDTPIKYGTTDHLKSDNALVASNVLIYKLFGIQLPSLKSRKFQLSGAIEFSAGILLFCFLLLYIAKEHVWPTTQLSYLFSLIFLGTLACGGLTEGKLWGVVSWVVLSIAGLVFLLSLPSPEIFLVVITALWGVHAVGTTLALLRLQKGQSLK